MRYGSLPVLVTIMRRSTDVNNVRGAFAAVTNGTLMGSMRQNAGHQEVTAGLPEDTANFQIRLPVTAVTIKLTAEDRFNITLSGVVFSYAINSVGLPERLGGYIEVSCFSSLEK